MNAKLVLLTVIVFGFKLATAQTDSTKSVSTQIKNDRDSILNVLSDKLKRNDDEVNHLKAQLASISSNTSANKIPALEQLQTALDKRLKILEEEPKTKVKFNGQLAFTELLSIQRDIQPADLFLTSQSFFNKLGSIGNLQTYKAFTSWKVHYDTWYTSKKRNDQMLTLVNNSLSLICDASNKVPLYGSIVQTVSSGLSSIVSSLGNGNKELVNSTPGMLELLNATSQFAYQKSIIDHEWDLLNKELRQLQKEDSIVLREQMGFYGVSYDDYKSKYLETTMDSQKDKFKTECRQIIANKLSSLDLNPQTKDKWMGQVETHMYKVQSLRLRFGQLTLKMQSNIDRYKDIISVYSNNNKFPQEFTNNVVGLENSLNSVKNLFGSSFRPAKYIEDSAVMYLNQN